MPKNSRVVLFAIVFFLAASMVFAVVNKRRVPFTGAEKLSPYAEGEVLVKFKEGVDLEEIKRFARDRGLVVKKHYGFLSQRMGQQLVLLKSGQKIDARTLGTDLVADLRVVYAHPNYRRYMAQTYPNDTRFAELWGLHNTGQTGGTSDADIDAPEAWDISTGSSSVIVAVIDSGIDYNHPDLIPNLWKNPGEIAENGIDDDGNGYVDDIYGIDPAGADGSGSNPDVDPMDGIGHGTHCSGTISGRVNNGLGVAGVNWNAKIMALKFFGDLDGGGWDADAIECMQYAIYQKVHGQNVVAINASWGSVPGGTHDSGPLRDAIEVVTNVGIVFCAAAGNGGSDGIGDNNDQRNGRNHHYPSDYTLPGIISVAATDHADALGDFSNYGTTSVDLGAPGVAILSTVPGTYSPQSGDIFFDDMESGNGNWITGGTNNSWTITTDQEGFANASFPVPSPPNFWSDRPDENYLDGTNSYLAYNANINLSAYVGQDLYFGIGSALAFEINDHGYIEFSNNGGSTWTIIHDFTDEGWYWSSWTWLIPDSFKTNQFRMRFRLQSNTDGTTWIGWLIDNVGIGNSKSYSYEAWGGTSMATPHVAGAVAWLAAVFPDETVAQRKERILYGGDSKASLSGMTVTGRRLNLFGAYNYTPAADPTITVTAPNGGETWMIGSNYPITWDTTGTVGNVDIYYSLNSGVTWTSIATGTANDGTHSWTVPSVTPSDDCLVRVWESSDREPADTSDLVFAIVSSSGETVTTPNQPSGPTTGVAGGTYTYSTGGSSCSGGHSVQYRFDWGDGSYSNWLPVGTTSASHTWMSAGTYNVCAMARCAINYFQSAWSSPLAVSLANSPTWSGISRFGASADAGVATLEWHTSTEIGVAGFHLWRLDHQTQQFERVNAELLPALAAAAGGGVYRFADPGDVYGQAQVYKLEEVDALGRSLMYGPFTVDHQAASWSGAHEPEVRLGRELPSQVDGFRRFERERSAFERQRLQARAAERGLADLQALRGTERVRVTVRGKGLFYVSAGQVAAALGVTQARAMKMIGNYNLNLTGLGEEIAWLAAVDGAGLYFYNPGVETPYSDRNVYFLEHGRGVAMEAATAASAAGADHLTYTERTHFEQNRYPLLIAGMDPAGDIWFWDYVTAGQGARSFTLHVPGVSTAGEAVLTVALQGATDTAADLDHQVSVSINGQQVGQAAWSGASGHVFETTFDASLLQEGANTIAVSGSLDTGAPYSTFYVESFDLSYPRQYTAENNVLICRADGHAEISVGGITDANVLVLDVSRPERPLHLADVTADVSGRINFTSPSSDGTFVVSGAAAAGLPLAVEGTTLSQARSRGRAAEHLVIAPAELARTARELSDYRRDRGMQSVTVILEDIYDAYSHGVSNPHAIREFIADVSNSGRLQYVVLAGKGTYDYNDYRGFGDNRVPVILASTSYGLFAADAIFGDTRGNDGLPEVAMGRLPAVTNAELRTMIDKIKAFEEGRGNWTGRGLFIADNSDDGGDFAAGCDRLDALASGVHSTRVYHSGDDAATRTAILNAWNAGVALVNYCGHAGIRNLAQEDFFNVEDATALQNNRRLPLAVMLTCVAGRFELPGYTTLAEALLVNPDGGMAGGLAPSGLGMHSDSMRLARAFFRAVYRSLENTAGKALQSAMRTYMNQGGEAYLLGVYNWLGDPATPFK
ncbi:MAG: C25 family cysteine peptidase [Acidobacteriota bacterium]|jgi:subtilisin family serine protease|nr:C25 family cysteine peptidase [Acidobacteriota bacterium]